MVSRPWLLANSHGQLRIIICKWVSHHIYFLFQERFVEIGRVAYIAHGDDKGKLCAIVDVVDQNRVSLEVARVVMGIGCIFIIDYRFKVNE